MSSTPNSSNFEMQKNFESAKFRILQHNCNRSTNVMQTILEYAVKNADIVLVQEPWIGNDNILILHPAFTPACSCGWHTQTAKHIIMFCKDIMQDRNALKSKNGRLDYHTLTNTKQGLKKVTRWLMQTGLLTQFQHSAERLSPIETQWLGEKWVYR